MENCFKKHGGKVFSTLFCLVFIFGMYPAQAQTLKPASKTQMKKNSQQDEKIIHAVQAVLDAQVAAWNHGDLEGFMKGYWRSPELTFNSGTNQTSGWDETLARYKKRYQSEGKEMGTLSFGEITILPLGRDAAVVRGRWKLEMKDSQPNGLFTLIFRRFPEGWRIIHDHTS